MRGPVELQIHHSKGVRLPQRFRGTYVIFRWQADHRRLPLRELPEQRHARRRKHAVNRVHQFLTLGRGHAAQDRPGFGLDGREVLTGGLPLLPSADVVPNASPNVASV